MAGGKVTHFFMCPSGQRPSYGSEVWEPIWTGLDEPNALLALAFVFSIAVAFAGGKALIAQFVR